MFNICQQVEQQHNLEPDNEVIKAFLGELRTALYHRPYDQHQFMLLQLMRKHMDWHWKINKKEKKRKKQAMSRTYFIPEDEWMNFVCGVSEVAHIQPALPFFNNKQKKDDDTQKPLPNLVADDSQPNCPICREKFDKFWDETDEEWMYRAVEVNDKLDKIVHVKCNGIAQQPTNTTNTNNATSTLTFQSPTPIVQPSPPTTTTASTATVDSSFSPPSAAITTTTTSIDAIPAGASLITDTYKSTSWSKQQVKSSSTRNSLIRHRILDR
eukprot:gene238-289_t